MLQIKDKSDNFFTGHRNCVSVSRQIITFTFFRNLLWKLAGENTREIEKNKNDGLLHLVAIDRSRGYSMCFLQE